MDVIDEQIRAYNARDIERFLATYAPEAVIEDGENNILVTGRDQMRERYRLLFESSPDLHCRIVNRIKIGKYYVDEEEVTGWNASPSPLRAVVIYRVEGEKIVHARMLRG